MSYNPVRAKNFYKRNKSNKRKQDPHAGIKHSDIMKRQGVGGALPVEGRGVTKHGFGAAIFAGEKFAMRAEVLAAGNSTGFGVNETCDRVYHVARGTLFIIIEGAPAQGKAQKSILQMQQGGSFRAPKGLRHGVASSGTESVELLIVEDSDYEASWQQLEDGTMTAAADVMLAGSYAQQTPAVIGTRRASQGKAQEQALKQVQKKNRRRPKMMGPTPAQMGQIQTQTGSTKVGRNASVNPNSGNVVGVSPQPMGPGSYED